MQGYYLTNDLFFASRVLHVAERMGMALRMLPSAQQIPEENAECRLVLLDLSLPGLDLPTTMPLIQQRAPAAYVVAYGPHVHEALLAEATSVGCQEVLTRGQFNQSVERILSKAVSG